MYFLRAEHHLHDVFALKFHLKQSQKQPNKYTQIVNKGDVRNILLSCLSVIPLILQKYPNASFGFIA